MDAEHRTAPTGRGRRALPAGATAASGIAGIGLIAAALSGPAAQTVEAPAPSASSKASAAAQPDAETPPLPSGSKPFDPALPRSAPEGLRIETIDLDVGKFTRLGLRPDGGIEAPRSFDTAGWYANGPSPGQPGAAVIGAHVDSEAGPALFYRLADVREGDRIEVERADGRTAAFRVSSVERHAKNRFPTDRVYGPTGGRPELRLITCGGEFDAPSQSYRDNVVVFAYAVTGGPGH